MPKFIDHDDDPGTTKAEAWLRTKLGIASLKRTPKAPYDMLCRAWRNGHLAGLKEGEAAKVGGE